MRIFLWPIVALVGLLASGQSPADRKDWIQLFNGKSLDGWAPKITGYPLGENYADTFRVANGMLQASYDKYAKFEDKFGHLFYERQKFSHYIIAAEYRFIGDQVAGGPDWAIRNNGLMLHSQSPQSMGKDQDFPISVEVQLLGGLPNGKPRSTANMCSPGTQVFINGTMVKGHCLNSKSQTYAGDQWVRVEVEVRGGERIDAQGRGPDRARVREADDRRRRSEQVRPGGQSRRHAPDRGLHRDPGREPPDRVPQDRAAQPLGLHGSEVAEVQELLRAPGRRRLATIDTSAGFGSGLKAQGSSEIFERVERFA